MQMPYSEGMNINNFMDTFDPTQIDMGLYYIPESEFDQLERKALSFWEPQVTIAPQAGQHFRFDNLVNPKGQTMHIKGAEKNGSAVFNNFVSKGPVMFGGSLMLI